MTKTEEREVTIAYLRALNVEGSEYGESIEHLLWTVETYYYCFNEERTTAILKIAHEMINDFIVQDYMEGGQCMDELIGSIKDWREKREDALKG